MNSSAGDNVMSAFADVPISPRSKEPHPTTGSKRYNRAY